MIKIKNKKIKTKKIKTKTKTPTERIFQLLITRIEKENKRWTSPKCLCGNSLQMYSNTCFLVTTNTH
jgi:hypothetical protein